jgi:uncharacterized protein (DUF1778 family)
MKEKTALKEEVIGGRVESDFKLKVEKAAKKAGLTTSQYVVKALEEKMSGGC